ncbi:RusA family crossover junction endodeoxyribonuclease [Marichromatium sp. AB31]|uniref:RusA family crossover junction endodeoxyribonuclease n=1 Tax=Marichromatium sp. AB31 TaxID=2483362 RepID=UPI0011CD725F|nr:RusA family crossover junction endodeoxyribonuclease [Marichromatium sp. AB31]
MTEVLLPYPPSANRMWRHVRGRVVPSADAERWQREAAWRAKAAGIRSTSGDVAVALVLHPRLTTKGRPSRQRLDLDNIIKPTLDALQGTAYDNDRQVVRIGAEVGEGLPGGGLTIRISAA